MRKDLVDALVAATNAPGADLAPAALIIARLEYPNVDAPAYLERLDRMGEAARAYMDPHLGDVGRVLSDPPRRDAQLARITAFNHYLFEDQQFVGNRDRYEDPRNSCLNEVLDRRTGIPITLSLVYMEVGRRAGLTVDGVNFPGHFLVRVPDSVIVDPFHAGALLSEHDCRRLLQKHVGSEIAFSKSLLAPATRTQIIVRMLLNLKRLYVHMRSFPQARAVTELLAAVTPSALHELRDRGLLAFHVNDMSSALRDLQTYLKLSGVGDMDKQTREERQQIWEHVKTLRRRIAGLN